MTDNGFDVGMQDAIAHLARIVEAGQHWILVGYNMTATQIGVLVTQRHYLREEARDVIFYRNLSGRPWPFRFLTCLPKANMTSFQFAEGIRDVTGQWMSPEVLEQTDVFMPLASDAEAKLGLRFKALVDQTRAELFRRDE